MQRGDEFWLCTDCTMIAVNGDASAFDYYYEPEEADQRLKHIEENMPPNLVPDWREEPEWICGDCGETTTNPNYWDEDQTNHCPKCHSDELYEREHGEEEFSRQVCGCCGTDLRGARFRFVQLI